MKKLGLVGGTGPESTLTYYKELNRIINEKTDGKAFPELVIDSVDLLKLVPLLKEEKYDEVIAYLSQSVKHLVECGADYVAFTAVTCHIVFDEVAKNCAVPMVGIPKATALYALEKGYRKVGLLGTIFTMDNDYMSCAFTDEGIDVIVPTSDEKKIVSDIIYSEFEYCIFKQESINKIIDVINRMKQEEKIEAVILGCTELPLAINDTNSPVACIDTVKVHIDSLVSKIME